MVDWKERYMREVEGLNNEGDPIGGDPPSGLRHQVEALKAENEALRKQVEILETKEAIAIEHLTKVVEEMNCLMSESLGVAELHVNGDIALWENLLRGGQFEEWLSYLSNAAEFVRSYGDDKKGGK